MKQERLLMKHERPLIKPDRERTAKRATWLLKEPVGVAAFSAACAALSSESVGWNVTALR
jgi:hypothetical protein